MVRMDRQKVEILAKADAIESVFARQTIHGKWVVEITLLEAGKLKVYTLQRSGRPGDREFATLDAAKTEIQRFWNGAFEVHPVMGEVVA